MSEPHLIFCCMLCVHLLQLSNSLNSDTRWQQVLTFRHVQKFSPQLNARMRNFEVFSAGIEMNYIL